MSLYLNSKKIIKDWTDYNGHMNVAYYVLIFDLFGAEVLMDKFNMGEESAKKTKKSTMVVESHITYNQELQLNDEVDINLIFFLNCWGSGKYSTSCLSSKYSKLAGLIFSIIS